jgi:hypothetical protein
MPITASLTKRNNSPSRVAVIARLFDSPDRVKVLSSEGPIRVSCCSVQLFFGFVGDQSLIGEQADYDPNNERTSAESEAEYFTLGAAVVPAHELVEIDDVPLQSPSERTAKQRQRLERRSADTVVVDRDLVRAGEIERLEYSPDVRSPNFRRSVSRAIGQQYDSFQCLAGILWLLRRLKRM